MNTPAPRDTPAPDAKCANCGLSYRVHKPINFSDAGEIATKPVWLCPIYLFREKVKRTEKVGS